MTLTPDTILAGTRVLAEFEGWTEKLIYNNGFVLYEFGDLSRMDDEFTYHTSYDALHSAWRVFRDLDQSQFTDTQLFEFLQVRQRIVRALGYDSIEKCFSLLVDAVSWYVAVKGGSHAV